MFGTRLKSLRKTRNITQQQLAQLCGLRQGNISVIESGRANVTHKTLEKLAAALGITVSELLDERPVAGYR